MLLIISRARRYRLITGRTEMDIGGEHRSVAAIGTILLVQNVPTCHTKKMIFAHAVM